MSPFAARKRQRPLAPIWRGCFWSVGAGHDSAPEPWEMY